MWPRYGVHITVCVALLAFVLCQPVHSLSHPYMGQISFKKSFNGDCTFLIKIFNFCYTVYTTHTIAVDVSSSHVCIDEWLPTASTLCPLSLLCKKAQVPVAVKAKLKWSIPREFHDYWWLFWMLHVSHYGTRLAEERRRRRRKKMTTILTFDRLWFATLR